MADGCQDINQKTARREFCGPNKKILPTVMELLDKDIEDAKKNNNKTLKKQLKRKYVEEGAKYVSSELTSP
jgi:hypothetical protein